MPFLVPCWEKRCQNLILSLGTMPLKLLSQLLLFLLACLVFSDTAKYGWAGGVVTAGDMVQQSARTLEQITGDVVKWTTEESPLAIRNPNVASATRTLKSTLSGFGTWVEFLACLPLLGKCCLILQNQANVLTKIEKKQHTR